MGTTCLTRQSVHNKEDGCVVVVATGTNCSEALLVALGIIFFTTAFFFCILGSFNFFGMHLFFLLLQGFNMGVSLLIITGHIIEGFLSFHL